MCSCSHHYVVPCSSLYICTVGGASVASLERPPLIELVPCGQVVSRLVGVQGDNMILLSPDKSDICSVMEAEDQAFFEQVTHHLCAVILTTGTVLRRFVKQRFGQVCDHAAPR